MNEHDELERALAASREIREQAKVTLQRAAEVEELCPWTRPAMKLRLRWRMFRLRRWVGA